jgi:hypothetical protein
MGRSILLCLLAGWLGFVLPNYTADAAQQPRSVLAGVKELEKPVTYTETKVPLGELVEKVAEETGVSLTAAREVADEPVAVVVKEMPARELLEQVAELLDYQWSRRRGGEGARGRGGEGNANDQSPAPNTQRPIPAFEIYQDHASRLREAAAREQAAAEAADVLRREVQRHVEIAALTPEGIRAVVAEWEEQIRKLQERRKKVPFDEYLAARNAPAAKEGEQRGFVAQRLSTPVARALANVMGHLTPGHWERLLQDGELSFASEPQPGELRLPEGVAGAFRQAQPSARPPALRTNPPPVPDSAWEERERRAARRLDELWTAATGYRVLFRLDRERHPQRIDASLRLDVIATPSQNGLPLSRSTWRGAAGAPQLLLSSLAEVITDFGIARTEEERETLEKDPVLGARRVLRLDPRPRRVLPGRAVTPERQIQELLPDIARAYEVQFIADAYWRAPLTYLAPGPPMALYSLLDRVAGTAHRWDRRGTLIRVRSRTWPEDRRREVPLRVVRRWREMFVRQGALPLDEYLRILTTLSEAQLEDLFWLANRGPFPPDFRDLAGLAFGRHAVRLYSSLTPAQRGVLERGEPIPAARMTPAQRTLFLRALTAPPRYCPVPVRLLPIPDGALVLETEPVIRIREERDGGLRIREEKAAEIEAPNAPRAAGDGQGALASRTGAPTTGAARTTVTEARFPAARLSLNLQYSPGERETAQLIVAAAP